MAGTIPELTSLPSSDRTTNLLEVCDVNGNVSYKATPNFLLGITGAPIGTTDSQTLTNKTLTAPTISSPTLSGTLTGTYVIGGTPTFPASVATLTGLQTFTNKTLTSPTITSPTITNASITADAITGFTTANTGTIYGVAITSGLIAGSAVTNIPAASLGTGAITLGYSSRITDFLPGTTAETLISGLTTIVTIPTGGRRIEIEVFSTAVLSTGVVVVSIYDGTFGSGGTKVGQANATTSNGLMIAKSIITPAAGSRTYSVSISSTSGNPTFSGSGTAPSYLIVKAI